MPRRSPSGTAPPRRVGISDVAAGAGVSIATVSRILNGEAKRASLETVARVNAVATRLGYRPAYSARALRTNATRLVAMLLPDITNGSLAAIVNSVEATLAEQDLSMILCNTRESPAVQDMHLAEMYSHHVRAIIMLGAVDSEGLTRALRGGIPLVFANRKQPGGMSYVGIDNFAAGQAVADHFVASGYRRCALLHGPAYSSSSRERAEGFRRRLAERGFALAPEAVIECNLSISGGYGGAAKLLTGRAPPRAVFCGNDQIAYGVYRRCRELGIAIPADMALFGFDNNPMNEALAPWLSTVHVPCDEFGPAIGTVLRAIMEDGTRQVPTEILLPFSLVLRESA